MLDLKGTRVWHSRHPEEISLRRIIIHNARFYFLHSDLFQRLLIRCKLLKSVKRVFPSRKVRAKRIFVHISSSGGTVAPISHFTCNCISGLELLRWGSCAILRLFYNIDILFWSWEPLCPSSDIIFSLLGFKLFALDPCYLIYIY